MVPGTTSLGVGVNTLTNKGSIDVSVGANAKGGTVFAEAFGLGVEQYAEGTSAFALSNSVFNEKTASLIVTAHATASGHGGRAAGIVATPVHATAIGITQANSGFFVGLPAFIENNFVSNNGAVFVSAGAKATGGVYAAAFASAEGIVQRDLNAVFGADTVLNNGSLTAIAKAAAKTTTDALYGATAGAHAIGISQQAGAIGARATAEVVNVGVINVIAKAQCFCAAYGVCTCDSQCDGHRAGRSGGGRLQHRHHGRPASWCLCQRVERRHNQCVCQCQGERRGWRYGLGCRTRYRHQWRHFAYAWP